MSSVIAAPGLMEAAATDLATIGSTVSAAHMAASAPTVAVLPAAADEVSASIAHLFSAHAQNYQGVAGQAAAFHDQLVRHLTAGAGSYAGTEAAAASSLQSASTTSSSDVSTVAGSIVQVVNSLIAAIQPQLPTILAIVEIAIIALAVIGALIVLAPLLPVVLPAVLPVLYPVALLLISTGKL